MTNQDNDTLNKGQQNNEQYSTNKSNNKDAMTAKLLASIAAGLAVGAGATYAANHFMGQEEPEIETPQTKGNVDTEQQLAEPTVEERVAVLEEKERIREDKEHAQHEHHKQEPGNQQQKPQETGKKEDKEEEQNKEEENKNNDILKGHDVKIESVETRTLDDGTTAQIYSGTIDGHQAVFMANSNGQVVAAIVDANDNGNVDDNEVIDLRGSNMTTQNLAQYQVTSSEDHSVEVVAVEHDVELEGETVDVAVVSIDEQPVMFVDRNQNGEVDVAIADHNHNGSIDEGEVQDVSEAHITMPTADDISGNTMMASTDDDTEDYSNNADVTVYDV